MRLSPGSRFDRYVLEEPLGEGGYGEVFRALDTLLRRRVALKIVAADAGEVDAARFLREARAAAAIHHPNVVRVFDVGEAEGRAFIAMELVAGKSLRDFVGDDGVPIA